MRPSPTREQALPDLSECFLWCLDQAKQLGFDPLLVHEHSSNYETFWISK